jgi:hypothetical protein
MSERWLDEVRKLRNLDAPESVWERALQGPNQPSREPPARRWVAALVAVGVFLIGLAAAWLAFAPDSGDKPAVEPSPTVSLSSIPEVASVICNREGVRTTTPVVRAQPDGIHVVFHVTGDWYVYSFPDWLDPAGVIPNPQGGHGGAVHPGDNPVLTYGPPGPFLAGCLLPNDQDALSPERYVRIRAVDPEGLFVPDAPDCVPGKRGVYRRVGSATDLDAVVRTIPGVLSGDEVLRPGYREMPWIIEPRVVIRDGRVVARVTMFGPSLESPPATPADWKLWVDACPGSGIGGVDLR